MGPPSLLSGAPSTIGSGSSSEWGREYEDEDTWYEWSSSYQTGPETYLVPKKDSGLSMRLAKYRRSGGKGERSSKSGSRMTMRERRDLRDLDKEAAMTEDIPGFKSPHLSKRSVWQLKTMVELGGTEGNAHVSTHAQMPLHDVIVERTDVTNNLGHKLSNSGEHDLKHKDLHDGDPTLVQVHGDVIDTPKDGRKGELLNNSIDDSLTPSTECMYDSTGPSPSANPLDEQKKRIKSMTEHVANVRSVPKESCENLQFDYVSTNDVQYACLERKSNQNTDAVMTCVIRYAEDMSMRDNESPPPEKPDSSDPPKDEMALEENGTGKHTGEKPVSVSTGATTSDISSNMAGVSSDVNQNINDVKPQNPGDMQGGPVVSVTPSMGTLFSAASAKGIPKMAILTELLMKQNEFPKRRQSVPLADKLVAPKHDRLAPDRDGRNRGLFAGSGEIRRVRRRTTVAVRRFSFHRIPEEPEVDPLDCLLETTQVGQTSLDITRRSLFRFRPVYASSFCAGLPMGIALGLVLKSVFILFTLLMSGLT